MFTNPNLSNQFVTDHQRQLLHEAEMERLVRQARVEQPAISTRLRLHISALLERLARRAQPSLQSSGEAPAQASGM